MATTNRQRIDEALELLRDALQPVIERVLEPKSNGLGWTAIIEELDRSKGRHVKTEGYSPDDLHVMLRAVNEKLGGLGFPFNFSRAVSTYFNEAAVLRNELAHMQKFSSDDTLRSLDTVARLLTELGAPEGARTLSRSRADLNRRVYAEQARADARSAFNDLGDDELSPWHEGSLLTRTSSAVASRKASSQQTCGRWQTIRVTQDQSTGTRWSSFVGPMLLKALPTY